MKKVLVLTLAFVLVAAMSVGLTLAYLTSQTGVVTNTFTAGNVTISLDEAKVDVYGDAVEGADRVDENEYKLIPGQDYVKDPTIHVAKGSEECYVFVEVNNGLLDAEADGDTTIAKQMEANGWIVLKGNVYYKAAVVDAREAAKDVDVFENFTLGTDVTVANFTDKKITVKAYAVQAAGFDSATAAWDATFGK